MLLNQRIEKQLNISAGLVILAMKKKLCHVKLLVKLYKIQVFFLGQLAASL